MTPENLNPVVKSWLKATSGEPPDPRHAARPIMARVAQTQQRSRWWPLPTFQRDPSPAAGVPSTESQPTPIPGTNGPTPTVTGKTMPMFSATKVVLAGVIVALAGGLLLNAQPFEQGANVPGAAISGPGAFSPAGSLEQARTGHTATQLRDGRVLVVGGESYGPRDHFASAEVWDQVSATFTSAGSLADPRTRHTATLLPDGRILIVGGRTSEDYGLPAEVWDPATASFRSTGSPAHPRDAHTATLLEDGRVLVVGSSGGIDEAEVWDPATEAFSPAGSLARAYHTATRLQDGRVLVVGGSFGETTASAEVWDPETAAFDAVGPMTTARMEHTATLLSDGRVLVVGGVDPMSSDQYLTSAEVWDPATEAFTPAGVLPPPADSLAEASGGQTATLLPDGRVLVVGGGYAEDGAEAWFWDPETATFEPASPPIEGREGHTATLLPDGRVLVIGGNHGSLASAEVWAPTDN